MSNTAPAYLESFQRIVISVDEISGPDDIKHFVDDRKDLTASLELPVFERHPYMTGEAVSCVLYYPGAVSGFLSGFWPRGVGNKMAIHNLVEGGA